MGVEKEASKDRSDDPCDVSKQYLLVEHQDKLKTCVDIKIKKFSEDVFSSLKEAGASQIIEYLIKIGIEYIDNLYKLRAEEAKPLIEDIWVKDSHNVERLFRENKFGRENILLTIRSVLSDKESGNLFESLLTYTKAIAQMGEYFKSNEVILYQLRSELTNLHNRGLFQSTVINLPSERMNAAPVSRGDLKIEVEVSKPLIVAGEQFSVFVSITNPFDVPVVVYSVETMIPVELVPVNEIGPFAEKFKGVAVGFATIDCESLSRGLNPPPYLLQPDDKICKQIVLKTDGNFLEWLNFTPMKLLLEIQVKYGVDYREHLDTVRTELDIQVGLKAIMVGAIVGGLIGGIVHLLSKESYNPWKGLIYIIIAVAFSAMAVVSFARKTGVQKIVSIEDFFGGLLIGFIVGFQGPEYASNWIFGNSTAPVSHVAAIPINGTHSGTVLGNVANKTITAIASMTNNTTMGT
jgi:thiamine transporter ThiT